MDQIPPLLSRSLLVLSASVTGTAVDIAERIGRTGRRNGWSVAVKSVDEFDRSELLSTPLIVFVLSTTSDGTAPPSFTPLWNSLLHPSLPSDLLEDLRFAIFGLGDSSYPKYNWVGRKLFRRLTALGASPAVERGEGDDQNQFGIESTFPTWLTSLFTAIDPLFPAPNEFVPISPNDLPPPRINLSVLPQRNGEPIASTSKKLDGKETNPFPGWSHDNGFAKVIKNERLTQDDWFQDVRSFELEIEGGTSFESGDVLEIRPHNSSADVQKFIETVGWQNIADVEYEITAISPDQPLPHHLPSPLRTTIRNLLQYELDIQSIPRVSFFEWLAGFSEGDMKEKLNWFCSGEGQDDLLDYAHRPRRTISEVLYEFRAAKISPEYLFDLIPLIRARGFSIASSSIAHQGEAHLLVAIVGYKTILSTPRKGVCTSYISELSIGDRIPIRFESGILRVPASPSTPLIMIGPGTGVAPFRALMEERKRSGATKNLLFFGCRSIKQDYYYESEWKELVESGHLRLSVAASRDQEDKIYVQQRIREESKLIWEYLSEGAIVYVCGSSTSMPKAVKRAFLSIFELEGKMDNTAAEVYWDNLEKDGRLTEETWG